MKAMMLVPVLAVAVGVAAGRAEVTSFYELKTTTLAGKPADLKDYAGKVALVVNVASKCGYTPQYKGLQALYTELQPKGFVILGFPSNDFGGQEPGTAEEIKTFCELNYGVSFPMMSKVEVNGGRAHPLWKWLTSEAPGVLGSKSIKWNFTKFLVGKDGQVIKRYAPTDTPESITKDIEAALAA